MRVMNHSIILFLSLISSQVYQTGILANKNELLLTMQYSDCWGLPSFYRDPDPALYYYNDGNDQDQMMNYQDPECNPDANDDGAEEIEPNSINNCEDEQDSEPETTFDWKDLHQKKSEGRKKLLFTRMGRSPRKNKLLFTRMGRARSDRSKMMFTRMGRGGDDRSKMMFTRMGRLEDTNKILPSMTDLIRNNKMLFRLGN